MEWLELPFNKVAEVVTGNTPPRTEKESYSNIGIPWVKPPDLDSDEPVTKTTEYLSETGKLKARILPKDSVMVCCIGTIGKVGIAGSEVATNQQINSLIFNKMVEPRFGYYYCKANSFLFQSVAPKAVVPILKKSVFEKIKIKFPTPTEQRRIVEILDQADEIRKLRKQADGKAEKIIPALFYDMFGDPVIEKKWPLLAGNEIFSEVRYGMGSPPPFSNEGIPFLRAGNIKPMRIIKKNLVYFKEMYTDQIKRSKVDKENIIIVRRGINTGDCAVITEEYDAAYVGYDLICVANKKLNPNYFTSLWHYPTMWQQIDQLRTRAAQQGLNRNQILSFIFPIPPIEIQNKFSSRLLEVNEYRSKSEEVYQNIYKLFDILLSKAFDGSLTASWREAHMKELLQEMEEQKKYLEKVN